MSGNAPSIFKKTLRNGLPVTALMLSSSFSLLAFMGVHAGSGKVFNWLANMISVSGLISWICICYTYTRFYAGTKAQGIDRKTLPFASPLQPFAAWYALVSCLVTCLVRVSVAIHLELNIDQRTLLPYAVQWLVGLPPWELEHGHLYLKLPPPCDVPDTVRWRTVLEANPKYPTVRDGFLLWTR